MSFLNARLSVLNSIKSVSCWYLASLPSCLSSPLLVPFSHETALSRRCLEHGKHSTPWMQRDPWPLGVVNTSWYHRCGQHGTRERTLAKKWERYQSWALIWLPLCPNTCFSLKEHDPSCPLGRAAGGTKIVRTSIVIGRVGTVSMAASSASGASAEEGIVCSHKQTHYWSGYSYQVELAYFFCLVFENAWDTELQKQGNKRYTHLIPTRNLNLPQPLWAITFSKILPFPPMFQF